MVTLQELYTFIKSLNKAEKRFFKLLSATENNAVEKALKLFDFLDKQKHRDDLEIKSRKESKTMLGAENVNQLYKLILASQRNFYSDSIPGFSLIDEVNNLKILFEKAQYKQCRKMLKSTKENALKIEKFGALMQLVEIEKHLLSQEMLDDSYSRLYDLLEEEQNGYRNLELNLSKFYILYAQLQDKLKNGVAAEQPFFKELLDTEFLKQDSSAKCKKSRFLFYLCRAAARIALHEAEPASGELSVAKQIMNSDAMFITEMPRQYIDVLFHSARLELIGNQPSDVPSLKALLEILSSGKMNATDLALKLRSYILLVRLQMNYNGRTLTETERIAEEILLFIRQNERLINHEDTTQLLFALTNYHIYTLSFVKAHESLSMLRKYTDRNNQTDLKNYSILQEYVIATENSNVAQINLIKPTLNKLVQSGFFRTDETEVINLLLNLPEDSKAEHSITAIIQDHHRRMNPDSFRNKLDLSYLNCINYLISKAGKDLKLVTVFPSTQTTFSETNS